jgi:hypothetical protein
LKSTHATVFYRCFGLSGSFYRLEVISWAPSIARSPYNLQPKRLRSERRPKENQQQHKTPPRNTPPSVGWEVEAYTLNASKTQWEINKLQATTLQTTNEGRVQRKRTPRAFGPATAVVGPDRYTIIHTEISPTFQYKSLAHRKPCRQSLFSTQHPGIEITLYPYDRLQFLRVRYRISLEGNTPTEKSNPFDSDKAIARPAYHTGLFWSSSPFATPNPVRTTNTRQEIDTPSNNRFQILDAIESKPGKFQKLAVVDARSSSFLPEANKAEFPRRPQPEPLLPSDRILIEAPTVKHTGLRGSNNYRVTCKYWLEEIPRRTYSHHPTE